MDVRIGIANSPRELSFESGQAQGEIEKAVAEALKDGSTHLSLTDVKGTVYIVPIVSLGYIEVGTEESRRIGFVG